MRGYVHDVSAPDGCMPVPPGVARGSVVVWPFCHFPRRFRSCSRWLGNPRAGANNGTVCDLFDTVDRFIHDIEVFCVQWSQRQKC